MREPIEQGGGELLVASEDLDPLTEGLCECDCQLAPDIRSGLR
jgi:hypothetical protein